MTIDPGNRDHIVTVVLHYVCDTVRLGHLSDRAVRSRITDMGELVREQAQVAKRLETEVVRVERVVKRHPFLISPTFEEQRQGHKFWDPLFWCAQMKDLIAEFRVAKFDTLEEYGSEIKLRPGHGGAPRKVMKRYCLRTLEGFSALVTGKRHRDRVRILMDAAFPPR